MDHIYSIPDARVAHSGKYRCDLVIEKQKKESSVKDLTVKVEREIGLLTFFFSNGPEELYRESTHNHQVEQKLALTTGTVNMLCYYSVNLGSTIDRSKDSSMISLDIQELEIKPNIKVNPTTYAIEGDLITFSCSVNMTQTDYRMSAKANDSGEYECI
ncbi:hypothetical protein cypCar_00037208 [Cyprinus carpio]|nr:hypothetical protein cypCar_00037208 [Cyprinus carpio]